MSEGINVTVNDVQLTSGQITTLIVALNSFYSDISREGLGADAHGKAITSAYLKRSSEVLGIMLCKEAQTNE